jgi:hypothetical protein
MRTLSYTELHKLTETTYTEFANGKTIAKVFQEYAVAKKHHADYQSRLLFKFINEFDGTVDLDNPAQWKMLSRFAGISSDEMDLGFVYCIRVMDKMKIGRTVDFAKRLGAYKSHCGKQPLVVKLMFTARHGHIESTLIKRLSQLGYETEWFEENHFNDIEEMFN